MSKETRKQFRKNSQYVLKNVVAFTGVGLKQAHLQQQIEALLEEHSDEDVEGVKNGTWSQRADVENVVYSDTESSEASDCDSDLSDEFADKKNEVQEKLRVTQRRFATLFAQEEPAKTVTQTTEQMQATLRRGNALMPQSLLEEDFRNRRQARVRHENYFGAQARVSFLHRQQWLQREQGQLDRGGEDLAQHTIFEENAAENSHSIDFPFMPRRPPGPDDGTVTGGDSSQEQAEEDVSLLFCDDFEVPEDASEQDGVSAAKSYETHSVATLDLSTTMQFHKLTETSPRTKFIASCAQAKVLPRASLLLRKNVSTELNLQHQGMGDTMAAVLALSLPDLPFVHSIDVTDNNLTGAGLLPLIRSVALLPSLTKINLSQNTVNRETAIALARFVAKTPILRHLVLHHADVDDYECTMFVAAITDNRALEQLDLSHNEIGTAELLNSVQPSLTTGAEALADFLCSDNCCMHTLSLQWNQIRLDGAVSLAEALVMNCSLTHLDLSFNALGTEAGEVLGHALLTNQTLRWLDLTSNNINSSACFTICMGLLDNYSIQHVNLDSNPIGNFGLRMVLQMPLEVGARLQISAQKCNLSRQDPKDELFSHSDPAGLYALRLEDPFQRAVCLRLLRLIATNNNYRFKFFGHQKPAAAAAAATASASGTGARSKRGGGETSLAASERTSGAGGICPLDKPATIPAGVKQIKLVLAKSRDKLDHMDAATAKVLYTLNQLEKAAGNEDLANTLFKEYDADGNGSLDVEEIHRLIMNIGITFDRTTLVQAIGLFDVDGAGTLEYEEFMQFLRAQRQEARSRIRQLTQQPIMASAKLSSMKYVPPKAGTMWVEVEDSFSTQGADAVMSESAHSQMLEIVRGGTESLAKVLNYSIQHAKMHLREALQIFYTMSGEVKDPALVVQKLLPRMATVKDARQLLLTTLSDVRSLNRLRKLMGSCLNPMIGLYNGYYQLDLSKSQDKVCMTKLLEQSQKLQDERIAASLLGRGFTGDISQKGDWTCFRNELKDGEIVQISAAMFNPMPTQGVYRFDFSGADRPPKKTAAISDDRFLNVLTKLDLLPKSKREEAELALHELRRKCVDNNPGVGNFSPVISTKQQAEAVQFYMLRFYSKNDVRHEQLLQAQLSEELKSTILHGAGKKKKKNNGAQEGELSCSSSEEEENDWFDEDDDINFVPLFRGASSGSLGSRRLSTNAKLLIKSASMSSQGIAEDSGEDDSDSDESDDDSGSLFSGGDEEWDEEGPMVGMMDLQARAQQQARDERIKLLGGVIPPQVSRKTLLNFDNAFETEVANTQTAVVRPAPLKQGSGQRIRPSTAEDSESAEARGMLAGRKKRNALNKDLTPAQRQAIEKQRLLQASAPRELKVHPRARALKLLSSLVDVFQRVWVRSRHIALILQHFTVGTIRRTPDFGSYRVELIVVLFCRVLDVQNFDLVWEQLQPQEIACIYCRLGVLSFFNPLKLEGCYSLDVSRYEERVVAKMLAVLSTAEPGENWLDETFRWEYFSECIPGWELTKSWLRDENMPHRGYLYLEYYSGGCSKFGVPLKKDNCAPDISIRKSLLALVLLSEDSIIDDECNQDAKGNKHHRRAVTMSPDGQRLISGLVGPGAMQAHIDHWHNLLAPARSTSALIAAGEPSDKVFGKLKYATTNIVKNLPTFADLHFGAGDVIIDKRSDKGRRLMERLQERLQKRSDREQEGGGAAEAQHAEAPPAYSRKKKMDLSVDSTGKLPMKRAGAKLPSGAQQQQQQQPARLQGGQPVLVRQLQSQSHRKELTRSASSSSQQDAPPPPVAKRNKLRRGGLSVVKTAAKKRL